MVVHANGRFVNMIDEDALKRDAQGCIADWPVMIRHYYTAVDYQEVIGGLNSSDDQSLLLPAGLLDKADVDIIAIFDDFTHGAPLLRDRIDIQNAFGIWIQYEVKRVPDIPDPLGVTWQFKIGTPDD